MTPEGRFPNYRDRPKKYLYDYLKRANEAAEQNAACIDIMRDEFENMLEFVNNGFPHGFRKTANAGAVPRVRFEAISVGTALALRAEPDLQPNPEKTKEGLERLNFDKVVVSDGANVRSKLEGRIDLVISILADE